MFFCGNLVLAVTVLFSPCQGRERVKDLALLLSAEKPEPPEAPNATYWEVESRLALLPEPHPWVLAALPSLAPFDYYPAMAADIADQRMTPLPAQEYRDITKPRVPLSLRCGAFNTGGQDRVFYQDDLNVFGVADGVGSSISDPGPLAAAILKNFAEEAGLGARGTNDHRPNDLHQLSRWARHAMRMAQLEYTASNRSSTTAVLGRVDAHNNLGVVNLGDSGFFVLRRDGSSRFRRSTVFALPQKQQAFNTPFQLSSAELYTYPYELASFPLRRGDLIVASSDGMLDNLYASEIEAIASRTVAPLESMYYSIQEMTVARKGEKLPFDLPTFADANEMLKYMTPPADVAQILVIAARINVAHCEGRGPFDLSTVMEWRTNTDLAWWRDWCGKQDDTAVAACWVY